MQDFSIPRILLSGVNSNSGAARLGLILSHYMKKAGKSVSCCLYGSDLQLAKIIQRQLGRSVRCLDPRLMDYEHMLNEMYLSSMGADILLIISPFGLYDSTNLGHFSGSPAELAVKSKTPVIISIRDEGYGNGVVPVLRGFRRFAADLNLVAAYVVESDEYHLSKTTSDKDKHYKQIFHEHTKIENVEVFDAKTIDRLSLPRGISHWENLTAIDLSTYRKVYDYALSKFNIDEIQRYALQAKPVSVKNFSAPPQKRRTRIAITDGPAFSLIFHNNLELLRYFGADLISFSPLVDREIPKDVGAIYLSGIILDEYLLDLAKRTDLAEKIKSFMADGGVVYIEGSAYVVCSEKFTTPYSDEVHKGWGLIPISATYRQGMQRRGGGDALLTQNCILGDYDTPVGYFAEREFKYELTKQTPHALHLSTNNDLNSDLAGVVPDPQAFASDLYLNFGSNPLLALNLVDAARVHYSIK